MTSNAGHMLPPGTVKDGYESSIVASWISEHLSAIKNFRICRNYINGPQCPARRHTCAIYSANTVRPDQTLERHRAVFGS
jgi:hypothetical protein